MKTIFVQSTLKAGADGGFPLAIFERSPEHEQVGGEIYIADDKTHEVVPTAEVMRAINDGRLKEVSATEAKADNMQPFLKEGDTAASLKQRYNKAQLLELAALEGVDTDDKMTAEQIATKIIDESDES